MNRREQKAFVKGISASITAEACRKITEGKIPLEWDGHELRAYLANRHAQSAAMSSILRDPRSKRAREFRNTCLVNYL